MVNETPNMLALAIVLVFVFSFSVELPNLCDWTDSSVLTCCIHATKKRMCLTFMIKTFGVLNWTTSTNDCEIVDTWSKYVQANGTRTPPFFRIFFFSSYSVFLSRILPGIFLSIILFSYNYDQFHKFHAIHNAIRLLSSLCFYLFMI